MKNKLFILPLIIFFILSFKTTENKNDDEISINRILSEIVSQDSSILNKNCKLVNGFNSPMQIPPNSYLEEVNFSLTIPYFKQEDIDYYSNQISKNNKIQLQKKDSFKSFDFISRNKIVNFIAKVESDYVKEKKFDYYERFEKEIGKIQEFGLPLISKDGKYVLIRFYCISGPRKNRGFLRIYEKLDNGWTIVKSIKEWDV